jgi:hypothetical protein
LFRAFRVALLVSCLAPAAFAQHPAHPPCGAKAKPSGLPLPSTFAKNPDPAAFQSILTDFLNSYRYSDWCRDKSVRDTGPWINGQYYGTHPAVRIYYSPEVMQWLAGGRKTALPDGAMMIKEQYKPPAAKYAGLSEDALRKQFLASTDWTVMIRDSAGSQDGWYWGGIWAGQKPDRFGEPFAVFNTGFGLYCTRCHASAEKELTFASEINIEGFPGVPLSYRVDNSWHTPAEQKASMKVPEEREELAPNHPATDTQSHAGAKEPVVAVNEFLAKYFTTTPAGVRGPIPTFPGETYDHVVARPGANGPQTFMTSDQCVGCHSAITYGNVMLAGSDGKQNISPYGEWRWSPMGLAGRDPIFYSQLESEIAYLDTRRDPKKTAEIVDLCFSCHGVLGERQLAIDTNDAQQFKLPYTQITDVKNPHFAYGALARDGVSCTSCHHIQDTKETFSQFLHRNISGAFNVGPSKEIFGPFKDDDIVQQPMEEALGVTPKHSPYIQSSRLCGSCHTIRLPVLDETPVGHSFEQLTYLEWVNSEFSDEFDKNNPKAQSCQDCHMRTTFEGQPIASQIAAVEDGSYPMADNRAPDAKIDVKFRTSGFARHQLQGLNVFLLEMFRQFNRPLGVRTCDYMLNCDGNAISDIPNQQKAFVQQARNDTATLTLGTPSLKNGTLTADVTVANLTGHRFPSGVSFRRAFIEFTVINRSGRVLFASGSTNPGGWIVDDKGNVLPSEWNGAKGPKGQVHQPHFYAPSKPITRSDQVQIYEELLKDAQGQFTTSFIRQADHFKDNRLLPRGWSRRGPNPKELRGRALEATHPHGTGDDPNFQNGNGRSVVRYQVALPAGTALADVSVSARLWYQAIPPYYLNQRFEQVPDGEATRRLYQLVTRLDTSQSPFPNWKLLIAESARK